MVHQGSRAEVRDRMCQLANILRSLWSLLNMFLSIIKLQTGSKTTWLPFICYFYLLLFKEQLKHSVSSGCPLLQDYSLLNLLAGFSIILSYVSLPSCSLTSRLGDREGKRQGEQRDKYRHLERERLPPEDQRLNITALNCQGCNISHFAKSLFTF